MSFSNRRSARPDTDGSAAHEHDSSFSLTLRPADFGDGPRGTGRSGFGSSRQATTQARGSLKRRELIELAGNPFVPDSQNPRAEGQVTFRQDIYPAYDVSGRRIGLEHIRNPTTTMSESKGYYRKHVHEYGMSRRLPSPPPSVSSQPEIAQVPVNRNSPAPISVQSKYPEQGPLPPVSAVIAGIPSDSQYGIGTFSHIQNQPRTPHEILGLPPGAPLNLWSLTDPETPDAKPQYNYHVLVKLAILGNKDQKATLQDILRAIRLRFPYYAKLPKQEAIAFGNSIRHLLSLLAAFVREPKPVTEPGKGSYWRVDFSKGEGNKRVRKRNKPQKRVNNGQSVDKQEKQDDKEGQDNRSESGDSQPSASASTETSIKSPPIHSPIETWPQTSSVRVVGKGGRKPAPKSLITAANGGTVTIPTSSAGASQDELYIHTGPAQTNRNAIGCSSVSLATPTTEPYLQLHPSSGGARRDHVVRGIARNAPYPPPLIMPKITSSFSPRSISPEHPEHDYRWPSRSPEDARFKNGSETGALTASKNEASLSEREHSQKSMLTTRQTHNGHAYSQRYSSDNGVRCDSASPQESPMSNQSVLSPYANDSVHYPSSSTRYPPRVSHNAISYDPPPPSNITYQPASFSTLSNVANANSVSNGAPYRFTPRADRQNTSSTSTMPEPSVQYHNDETRANSVSWSSSHSDNRARTELSKLLR